MVRRHHHGHEPRVRLPGTAGRPIERRHRTAGCSNRSWLGHDTTKSSLHIQQHGYDFFFYHIHPEPDPAAVSTTESNATSHFLSTPLEGEVVTTEGFDRHYQETESHDKYQQGCRSPADNGELRSSPWCKVAVLDKVLQLGYKYAVIIDTDALFVDMERSIAQLLDEYVDPARRVEQGGTAGVFVSSDKPFRAHRINTGFMIAQASPEAQRFLRAWWDTPSGEWLTRSPFEQEVLNLEREAGNNTALLENGEPMSLTLMLHGPRGGGTYVGVLMMDSSIDGTTNHQADQLTDAPYLSRPTNPLHPHHPRHPRHRLGRAAGGGLPRAQPVQPPRAARHQLRPLPPGPDLLPALRQAQDHQ